jgi:hypothetical protein
MTMIRHTRDDGLFEEEKLSTKTWFSTRCMRYNHKDSSWFSIHQDRGRDNVAPGHEAEIHIKRTMLQRGTALRLHVRLSLSIVDWMSTLDADTYHSSGVL